MFMITVGVMAIGTTTGMEITGVVTTGIGELVGIVGMDQTWVGGITVGTGQVMDGTVGMEITGAIIMATTTVTIPIMVVDIMVITPIGMEAEEAIMHDITILVTLEEMALLEEAL